LSVIEVGSFSIKTRRSAPFEEGGLVGAGVIGSRVGEFVFSATTGAGVVGDTVGRDEGDPLGLEDGRFDGETVGEEESVGGALGQTNGVGLGEIVG